MLALNKEKKLSLLFFIVILIPTLFFLFTHAPKIGANAPTYEKFTIIRQPLYAIFIWLFCWAGKYQYIAVMWAQSFLTLASLMYARYWLKKNLKLPDFFILIVFAITLITISFYYQMQNMDDPEGITFPIFIFTFFITVNCFQQFNLKKISLLGLLVSILILTRTQFYFYYGIFLLIIISYAWRKVSIKHCLMALLIFFLSAVLTNVIDRTYHYYANDHFVTEPFSGILLIVQPLYLADSDAANYFFDPKLRKNVGILLRQIREKKLNQFSPVSTFFHIQYYEYTNEEYMKNYLPIQFMVHQLFTNQSFDKIYQVSNANLIKMNDATLYISKILFLQNIKQNMLLYFYRVISMMGGIPYFLFFCILLFVCYINLFSSRARVLPIEAWFVTCFLFVIFLNTMIVSVAEPSCTRYFCYTQFLLYCFAAYIGKQIFYSSKL